MFPSSTDTPRETLLHSGPRGRLISKYCPHLLLIQTSKQIKRGITLIPHKIGTFQRNLRFD